jgi:hypothetical protein
MSANTTGTIAFFGATGGCANACLAHALMAGHHATALARTPSKLTNALLRQEGITTEILSTQLSIVQGDGTDISAVKATLLNPDNGIVRAIISGIGGAPMMEKSLIPSFTLDNPNITEQTTTILLDALREIYAENPQLSSATERPQVTVISTTGLTGPNVPQDVPFLMRGLYHKALAVPHADKLKMENLILAEENRRLFSGVVVVRPTLLTGDGSIVVDSDRWQKLRVGTEDHPAVGWTVSRADVGQWIFEEVLKAGGQKWFNQKVTLTN